MINEFLKKEGLTVIKAVDLSKLSKEDTEAVIEALEESVMYDSNSSAYVVIDDVSYLLKIHKVDDEISFILITKEMYMEMYNGIRAWRGR